ncbi:MAG TPA: phosphatidylglycerophosphatase A [Candidatus Hydrothermia bacterium]|nr:phosphatidylglycerophosphatase A [Candidatus Hydrothermae bacterium]MDD3649655.1 phosphatidylglycerophosphatase A [Candidatus Hydrothermia bacterium]MDD5572874.1 phosphatidylglycerophosphatase A [Candidatus Hydrothermia bacterium]HOK23565.1 phosphatidylglycerophosphatase A [Candidatus Hydrothermia bacterium]HOL24286.1 phosphatidylglycerophosphatase A [Candidatus Hydrothermia bacterium]
MRKTSYTLGVILYIVSILYLGIYPKVRILPVSFDASFIFHILGFFLLYLILVDRLKNRVASLLISLVIAVLVEIIQGYFPERMSSSIDLIFDIAGILAAMVIDFRWKDKVFIAIATVLGIGFIPVSPGTLASLVFLVAVYYSFELNLIYVWQIFVILLPIALFTSQKIEDLYGDDPKRCVIDEVLGMSIPLIFVQRDPVVYGLSFGLFRIFDIVKPLGLKKAEKVKGGVGIILDDILAGFLALIFVKLIMFLYSNLRVYF